MTYYGQHSNSTTTMLKTRKLIKPYARALAARTRNPTDQLTPESSEPSLWLVSMLILWRVSFSIIFGKTITKLVVFCDNAEWKFKGFSQS